MSESAVHALRRPRQSADQGGYHRGLETRASRGTDDLPHRWNLFTLNGLVKQSARLSAVPGAHEGDLISCDSTMSRMKKCRGWTCFMRSWCSGL